MNHAYVDGSFSGAETPRSAYGVVLLRPGWPAVALSGVVEARDCNVAELRAVQAAVEYAPRLQALTVHTDNGVALGAWRPTLNPWHEEAAQVVRLQAAQRGIDLRLVRAERSRRHMQLAHQLANAARLEALEATALELAPGAQCDLRLPLWQPEVMVTVRRAHEVSRVQLGPPTSTPRSVEALLCACALARPQETLLTTSASKLAAALWHAPRRALDPELQLRLRQLRAQLEAQQTQVVFERVEQG